MSFFHGCKKEFDGLVPDYEVFKSHVQPYDYELYQIVRKKHQEYINNKTGRRWPQCLLYGKRLCD